MGISESSPADSAIDSIPQKIYILKLIAHKYYVGRTNNVERRYIQHNSGEYSEWTRKYKPINIIETKDATSPFDEDKIVLEYMEKYGMENVRGGSYANAVLSIEQKTYIIRIFNGANDRCYKCNSEGHFVKQCTTMINNCTRCGRNNHNSDKCYAKTHFDGLILSAITSDKEVTKKEMSKYNHIETLTDTKDLRLFALLKTWRLNCSRQLNIKAYEILKDVTLIDICAYKPTTLEELSRISGIGPQKSDDYGIEILNIIKDFND